jgi:hypothetical protein
VLKEKLQNCPDIEAEFRLQYVGYIPVFSGSPNSMNLKSTPSTIDRRWKYKVAVAKPDVIISTSIKDKDEMPNVNSATERRHLPTYPPASEIKSAGLPIT